MSMERDKQAYLETIDKAIQEDNLSSWIANAPNTIPALQTWLQLWLARIQELLLDSEEGFIPFFKIASLIIFRDSAFKSWKSQS